MLIKNLGASLINLVLLEYFPNKIKEMILHKDL